MGSFLNQFKGDKGLETNQVKTKSVDKNTTDLVGSGKKLDKIKYEDVKTKLGNTGFQHFVYLIDSVENTESNKLKEEAKKVFFDIMNEDDLIKLSSLGLSLQKIVSKYEKEKEKAQTDSGSNRLEVSDGIEGMIAQIDRFLFDPISLKEIKELKIDGKVENFNEFQNKLNSLISIINRDKKINYINKKKFIKGLRKIAETVKEKQKYTLDFLNDEINNLGEQIESQEEGNIIVDIKGEKIPFSSKKEAYDYIKFLKEEAENEFQSFYADIGDILGSVIGGIFSSDLPLKPYKWAVDSIKDGFRNYEDNDHWALLTLDGLQILILSIMSINYTETIFRRVVKDTAGKMGLEWGKIGNFDTQRLSYQTGEGDQERQAKYNRRLDAYNFLKNNVSQIKPEYKEEYLKELESIRNYINIDSKTFWLKFEALKNERGILGRGINAFKHGPKFTFYDIERRMSDFINAEINSDAIQVKENLSYAFNDVEVIKDDKGPLNITVGEETKEIKKLRNYINSISDSDRRIRTMEALDKYLSYLKNNPTKKEFIKTALYNIIENNFYDRESILSEIDKKYFPDKEELIKLTRNGRMKWFLEVWDGTKENLKKLKEISTEKWGKYAPTSLTYGKALAFKLRNEVKKGNFEGNKNDLKDIFNRIDSGKLAFNSELPGWNKLKAPIKLVMSTFGKYGLKLPTITELRNFGEKLKNKKFKDIMDEGSNFEKEIEKSREILKGETSENLKNIFDLDTINFPSDRDILYGEGGKERFFEKMYEKLLEKSEKENFRMIPDNIKLEIVKLRNGYLTNDKILEILESSFTTEEMKVDNIKDFVRKVETNKIIITLEDFKNRILGELRNGDFIQDIVINFNIEDEIKNINERGSELGETHFKKGKFGIFNGSDFDTKDYKKRELGLSKILNFQINDYRGNSKLGELSDIILKGTSFTGVEFFDKLNEALNINILFDEHTTRDNFRVSLKTEVENFFNSLSRELKREVLNFINTQEIDKSILPDNIKKAYKTQKIDKKNDLEEEKNKKIKLKKLEKRINELVSILRQNNLKELKEAYQDIYKVTILLGEDIDLYKQKIQTQIRLLELEKVKLTNENEYKRRVKTARIKAKLFSILDGKKASDVKINSIGDIAIIEIEPKYNNLLKDFYNKVKEVNGLEGIDFDSIEKALILNAYKDGLIDKFEQEGRTDLKRFLERAGKLGKEFFKEIKKR